MKPFESSYLKLRRALEHLKALREQLVADHKAKPFVTEVRLNERLGGNVVVAEIVAKQLPDLPLERGAVVGDVIANFRAALDHAAWRLVLTHGATLTPGQQRRVQFPLATSAASFRAQFTDRLPGVPFPDYGAFLQWYQPYRRTPEGKALRLLRDVSDRDKHRVVTLSYVAPSRLNLTVKTIGFKIIDQDAGPARLRRLKEGAVIARVYLRPPVSGEAGVKVEGGGTLSPTFERGTPLIQGLLNIARVSAHLIEHIEHAALSGTPLPHRGTPLGGMAVWGPRVASGSP